MKRQTFVFRNNLTEDKKIGIKVLSLFDGISCGRVALERAGIDVDTYYASEIEPTAIAISQKNYPDILRLGDVSQINFKQIQKVDLLIGGSPCQGLSNSNVYLKDGEYGVNGTGVSSLFWHYIRAIKTIQPKYFLYENVSSMKNADKQIITEQLGVEPVMINSVLFSGQIRRRLYWTNIPFEVPTERIVTTKVNDIIESSVDDKYYVKSGTLHYITNKNDKWRNGDMSFNPEFARPVTASCWKIHRADTDTYIQTEYQPEGRTNVRRLIPLECERLQTLPDNYTKCDGVNDKYRYLAVGNGWTVDVIAHILKGVCE